MRDLKNNPSSLIVFLCLNFYLSTTVWTLHGWQITLSPAQIHLAPDRHKTHTHHWLFGHFRRPSIRQSESHSRPAPWKPHKCCFQIWMTGSRKRQRVCVWKCVRRENSWKYGNQNPSLLLNTAQHTYSTVHTYCLHICKNSKRNNRQCSMLYCCHMTYYLVFPFK